MNQSPLTREFFETITGYTIDEVERNSVSIQINIQEAERCAALCERKIQDKEHEKNQQIDKIIKKRKKQESEKIKRAIELARTGQMPIGWTYNEQEILELLNK